MTDQYGPGSGGSSHGYGPGAGYGAGSPYSPGWSAGPDPSGYGSGSTDSFTRPDAGRTVSSPGGGGMDDYVDPEAFGRPPVVWLAVAALVAVAATVVAIVLGATIEAALGAWLAAGPVAIGLLAVYTHRDTVQRARAVYDGRSEATIAYWVTAAIAVVGILVSAWRIAQWAGRL